MKLTDIIALAKQGYKPADIKELITLAEDDVETEPETLPEDDPKTQPETEPTPKPDNEINTEVKDDDNRPTLDELQKEVEKLKGELKVAQQKNVRAEVDPNPTSVDDAIDNMFREYM